MIDRSIGATIVSVLIVDDGWQHLKFVDVGVVVVGPVLAVFLSLPPPLSSSST